MIRRTRVRGHSLRILLLAATLQVAGCEGEQGEPPTTPIVLPPPAPPPPPPPPPPTPAEALPQPIDSYLSLTLVQEGPAQQFRIPEVFRIGPDVPDSVTVEASSADDSVATARVEGSGLKAAVVVEPVAPGKTPLFVTLTQGTASVTKTVWVNVLAPATQPPQTNDRLSPFTLTEGGAPVRLFLYQMFRLENPPNQGSFDIDVMAADARSRDAGVVTVAPVAGLGRSHVLVTPVGAGKTTVEVRVRNAAGSASLTVPVTVDEARPLRVVGAFSPLTFFPGRGEDGWLNETLFHPPGYSVEIRSNDEQVVRVEGDPFVFGTVRVTPVGTGETTVVVTGRNAVSEAEFTVKVTVLDKVRIGLFNGLGSADAPVRLAEGAQWELDIRALDLALESFRNVVDVGFTPGMFQIITDAPPTELRVPQSVPGAVLGTSLTPVPVPIEALADDVVGEPEAMYSISLAPAPGLPSWIEVSEEPVRVVVVDSPVAACEELRVDARLENRSGALREGTFVIQSPHPDTKVSFASPYVAPAGYGTRSPTFATHVFPEELPFRETPDGFEQTVRLRWWDDDLRFTVETPGCEPVEVVCDDVRCEVE